MATLGLGRVGKVNPGALEVSIWPRFTRVATLGIVTVVSTPLNVRVAVFVPDPRRTELVPEPEHSTEPRHVKTPAVAKAPSSANESALATRAASSAATSIPAVTIFILFLRSDARDPPSAKRTTTEQASYPRTTVEHWRREFGLGTSVLLGKLILRRGRVSVAAPAAFSGSRPAFVVGSLRAATLRTRATLLLEGLVQTFSKLPERSCGRAEMFVLLFEPLNGFDASLERILSVLVGHSPPTQ